MTHFDTFRFICNKDFKRNNMRSKGEKLIRVCLVKHEIILHSLD